MKVERSFEPTYAVPPGETLSELLEERGMTQTDLADRLGVSLKHANQVVNGAASISAELALGLEKVLGVSSGFWLNRESLFRADLARQGEAREFEAAQEWAREFPLKELKQRGFLAQDAKGADIVGELLRFLGVAKPELWTDPAVAYRKSRRFESDRYALAAWLRVGELAGNEIECEPYDAGRFLEILGDARSLTRLKPRSWHPKLVKLCAGAGVAVVIQPLFTGARANGATCWLSSTKALIQLSLRYKWEDVFWFSFFHEAGHVLRHRKRLKFLEGPRAEAAYGDDPELLQLEEEADQFASDILIPPDRAAELRWLGLADVRRFAAELGVSPAIVVGRLQHDRVVGFNQGNDLRRRLEFVS